MKAKYISLLVFPTLLLSSCTSLFGGVKSSEKEIAVYDIDRLDEQGNLSSGYQTTLQARFISGQECIPYLTLSQYASLYDAHLANGFTSTVESQLFSSMWTIKNGEDLYFACSVNYLTCDITMVGSISSTFSSKDDPRDLAALNYGLKSSGSSRYLSENEKYANFSFYGYGINHFTYNKEHYYPLGLLDLSFSDSSTIYFTYNYSHIFSTREVDNYSEVKYIDNDVEYTFDSQMESNRPSETIPKYLRDYNSHLFLYVMDHFYGLKKQKGYASMAKYCREKGFYSNLFSSDNEKRTWAFADSLSSLDDNHTALVSVNKTWGDPLYSPIRRYGEGCYNRSKLRSTLKEYRADMYEDANATAGVDVIYSDDGKTALFSFDSFAFGTSEQVFNEDGSIKETAKEHDTFFKLIDAFNRIENQGTVENVVLDISLNGGGTVGVMMKLLGLISASSGSYLWFYDDLTTQLDTYTYQVDIHNDKVYDTSDCFGDDFNIYLLTSDCSYSCGNAFPCIAQLENDVAIIGQKSGGGECAVAVHYLPNSEYVYHSSNLHLGSYDEQTKVFSGFEGGAIPDIEIPINANFYSIEAINTAIRNAQ